MSIFQALVLGVVQGLTEFLPISSSAHLVLVPFILGWKEPTLAFDVAVHLGTLISVCIVFRERLIALFKALVQPDEANRKMLRLLIIGTVPAVIAGVALNSLFDRLFHAPVKTAFQVGITGWILIVADRWAAKHETTRGEAEMNDLDAATIGVAQAISIVPGISRSGATIAAGLWRGIDRVTALRYSFLLSIPAIAGAIVFKIPDMVKESGGGQAGAFIVGIIASAVSGIIAIRAFLKIIERRGLRVFAVYCFAVMAAGILTGLARG
jgi:undecaprenyl-diphosphatase